MAQGLGVRSLGNCHNVPSDGKTRADVTEKMTLHFLGFDDRVLRLQVEYAFQNTGKTFVAPAQELPIQIFLLPFVPGSV